MCIVQTVHFHMKLLSFWPQLHPLKLGVTYHLNQLRCLHFKLWSFKSSPSAHSDFIFTIPCFYLTWSYLSSTQKLFLKFNVDTQGKRRISWLWTEIRGKRKKARVDPRMQGEHLVCLLSFSSTVRATIWCFSFMDKTSLKRWSPLLYCFKQ